MPENILPPPFKAVTGWKDSICMYYEEKRLVCHKKSSPTIVKRQTNHMRGISQNLFCIDIHGASLLPLFKMLHHSAVRDTFRACNS